MDEDGILTSPIYTTEAERDLAMALAQAIIAAGGLEIEDTTEQVIEIEKVIG